MEYIKDHWNGRLSLKTSFYFNFLAVDIVAILPWSHIQATSLKENSPTLLIYLLVLLIITGWSTIGVFTCVAKIGKYKEQRHRVLSFFEKIAIIVAMLWLITIAYQSYTSIRHSNNEFLKRQANPDTTLHFKPNKDTKKPTETTKP